MIAPATIKATTGLPNCNVPQVIVALELRSSEDVPASDANHQGGHADQHQIAYDSQIARLPFREPNQNRKSKH